LTLKSCHNKHHAVIVFCGQNLNANQIHFEMHPVYGDKCFAKATVSLDLQVYCKKMLGGQKFASDTETQ